MKVQLSAAILLALILSAALALWLIPFDYATQDRDAMMTSASAEHFTGTDALGRDRTVRMAAALLMGLAGATVAAALTTTLAAAIGLCAAFSPRWAANLILFVSDGFLSLPWLFLLMIARSLLPLTASPLQTALTTFLILAALGWPACARVIFHGATALRSADWMVQGCAGGLRTGQLMRLHLLPHLRSLILPQFLVCIPAFVVAEANLGALGLGVGEPMPSWGGMLLELDNSAMIARSHWVYLPIVLLIAVLLILESFTTESDARA
jgi:peptide/nickel transport system permease protein